jgi:serine phosphatase RsbU (regulator of sigma subunit)/anti-sigma regulatory factor (Ser/Thr protein kinase)/PAS domain-containing protein
MVSDALIEASSEVRQSGQMSTVVIDGVDLRVIPIIALSARVESVFIGQLPVEDIPAVLSQISSEFSRWFEIIHALPDIVLTARPDGRVDFWNDRWKEYTHDRGFPSLSAMLEAVDDADQVAFFGEWRRGIEGGRGFATRLRLKRHDGESRWHRMHAEPIVRRAKSIIKWLITFSDMHDEAEARELAEASERRFRFLSEASRILLGSLNLRQIARRACRHASASIANEAAILLCDFNGACVVAHPKDSILTSVLEDLLRDSASVEGESCERVVDRVGDFEGFVSIRLRARERTMGRLLLRLKRSDPLGAEDAHVLEEFGRLIASALDNARMYANERRIASALQSNLLPASLHQPYGMKIDSAYFPADDELRVGGDWYDAFELRNGYLAVSIGDIAGHGVNAAAVMGAVRQSIRTALLDGASAGRALALANDVVYGGEPGLATAFVGVLDPVEMSLQCASAGHPGPLLVQASGTVEMLEVNGTALGVLEQLDVEDFRVELPHACGLVLYTDGMIEYSRDVNVGLERLHEVCVQWSLEGMQTGADVMAEEILGGQQRADDAALLLLRIVPVHDIDVTFAALPSQSAIVRRMLARFAREWMHDQPRANDVVLAACEAVNNAIEHAYDGENGAVRLRARRSDGKIVVSVDDSGKWNQTPPDEDRGRGLSIMRALANDLDIRRRDDGTSVSVVFDLEPDISTAPVLAYGAPVLG